MAYFGCIKKSASPPTPPEPNYLYKWDFTKAVDPLVDEINGELLKTTGNPTIQSGVGLKFTDSAQRAGLPTALNDASFDWIGKVLEIEFGDMDLKASERGQIIGSSKCYLVYYDNSGVSRWVGSDGAGYYVENTIQFSDNTNPLAFKNTTIKIIFKSNEFCVYRDDELVLKTLPKNTNGYNGCSKLHIGSNSNDFSYGFCYYDMTIKEVRIYENEEV